MYEERKQKHKKPGKETPHRQPANSSIMDRASSTLDLYSRDPTIVKVLPFTL